MKWSIEEKGPFRSGETKREFVLYNEWCDIRCDYKQYESLAKDVDIYKKAYRKIPANQEFSKKDESEELQGEDITRYRSVVGRLMYLAGERPSRAWQSSWPSQPNRHGRTLGMRVLTSKEHKALE